MKLDVEQVKWTKNGQKDICATATNDVILKPPLPVGQMPKVDGNLTAIYGRNVTLHCPADDIVDGNRVSWDLPRYLICSWWCRYNKGAATMALLIFYCKKATNVWD